MKLNHKSQTKVVFLFSLFLFCFLSLQSCGMKAEQKSLTTQFDIVDALISQNQFKAAVKELKSIQKKAYDSWSTLGIYRRYVKIGQDDLAENLLKKSIKKNKTNQELSAVYTSLLLKQNRIDEAVEIAKILRSGKYGSLYSEAILKQALNAQPKEKELQYTYFNKEQFYQIYWDAYVGTGNPVWLKNCAVYQLTQGFFGDAAGLLPVSYADADDAYFWALVLYDAGKFYEAIDAIEQSKVRLNDYENKQLFKTTFVKQIALESDCYMAVSQMEAAESIRQELISKIDIIHLTEYDKAIIPIVFTNSALWAKNQNLSDSAADLLFYTVSNYPDYVPALIQYADFAYESNLERKEDDEIVALRKAGISTIEMEKYDSRRKIPVSDALYRINKALERNKNPYLEIKKIDLKYKTQKGWTEKEKNRNLWNLLENNYDDAPEFKSLLVQYSVNFLIATKQYEDAWNVYYKFVTEKIEFDEKQSFWENYIGGMKELELPIVEIGAWFASYSKLYDEALRIYEYCVYESNGILEDKVLAQYVSTAACMNLGDIYFSNGKKEKAIDLYSRTVGRESKNSLRSEIYYRIACIYVSMGDNKSALRSAEYAKELYPENVKAGLLKDKILSISK